MYYQNAKAYMVLSKDSDGLEKERWYDFDGQLRYNLIGGKIAGTRVREEGKSRSVSSDPYGNKTTKQYNRFEAVESVTYPDGSKVEYEYLPQYNFVTLKTDEAGVKTRHQYDSKGNRTKTTMGFASASPRVQQYQYDIYGQRIKTRILGKTE